MDTATAAIDLSRDQQRSGPFGRFVGGVIKVSLSLDACSY
jgi:hypothetical protein